ncbi:MAG: PepSY domain-containing protein [Cyanobacteria bacterium J06636_16]
MKLSIKSLMGSLLIASIGGSLGVWIIQNGLPFMMDRTTANMTPANVTSHNQSKSAENFAAQARFDVTLLEALEIANLAVDGEPHSIEQEIEDEVPVIEIELSSYEVAIHARTKEVLLIEDLEAKGNPEDIAEFTEALALQPYVEISLAEAITTAEESFQEQANTAELENEDGNLVYEIIFGLEKVYVDAGNGEILHSELLKHKSAQVNAPLRSSVQVPERAYDRE